MVQKGGPAALNGFLYQILNHLGWLSTFHISGRISGADMVDDARIVLEPKDGGDARAEGTDVYLVEQYKARPDGTWSVQSIIDDVLPDLRSAVLEPPHPNARYRFVTDGKKGKLNSFNKFLEAVCKANTPVDLDAIEVCNFGKKLPDTYRALFEYIVKKTKRPSERIRKDEVAAVFHLLQNLEMDGFGVSFESSANRVDEWLRPMCANRGDEAGKRRELVGMLMDLLRKGETDLTIESVKQMLHRVGLNPDSMGNLYKLHKALASILDEEFKFMGYEPEMDVRQPPEWPSEKPILVTMGASGEGKTWLNANYLRALARERKLVVWLRWERGVGTKAILDKASELVWQEGLGFTDSKTIAALQARYRDMASGADMPWLTIGVDDIQDTDAAREFVRQRWEQWGIRLVMSVPAAVGAALRQEPTERIHFHALDRFSVAEVDELLSRKGRKWGELPSDLQQLLRTPILAGLYLQLPNDTFKTSPNSEYEIFDAFWRRMQSKTKAGDDGILISIAARILEGEPYPVERGHWSAVGLDLDNLERLRASGWIKCLDGGLVIFAHDRLLNWAVAEALVRRMLAGVLTEEQVGEILLKCGDGFSRHFAKQLGYVPMDLLWLLAGNATKTDEIADLIGRMEDSPHYGSYGKDLYVNLLPTLGERVVNDLARLSRTHNLK